jgi:hypothetical protein
MCRPAPAAVCEHCERAAATSRLGLCERCDAVPCIRILYTRRGNRPPWWDAHLRRLAERAKQRLPLFDRRPRR